MATVVLGSLIYLFVQFVLLMVMYLLITATNLSIIHVNSLLHFENITCFQEPPNALAAYLESTLLEEFYLSMDF